MEDPLYSSRFKGETFTALFCLFLAPFLNDLQAFDPMLASHRKTLSLAQVSQGGIQRVTVFPTP